MDEFVAQEYFIYVDLQVKKLELKKEDFKISLVYITHKSETAQFILGSLFFGIFVKFKILILSFIYFVLKIEYLPCFFF